MASPQQLKDAKALEELVETLKRADAIRASLSERTRRTADAVVGEAMLVQALARFGAASDMARFVVSGDAKVTP